MNANELLRKQLEIIKPNLAELKKIEESTSELVETIRRNLKKQKINSQVFVGGSSAKNTLIKKSKYDIDIFVRFDKKYSDNLSKLLKRALPKNAKTIHGSRDYFSILENGIHFEIVPVLKINKPEEAQNITDLSYFHVNYVKNQINKNKKLADEIRLAKAFAYYQDCYGAESYVNGFSGYAIELLVIHYKTFMNFLKAMAKIKENQQKLMLDPDKKYKNRQEIEEKLNPSKLMSPIILIDPTFRERNALAALSQETFDVFQKSCRAFLANPSSKFFELENKELELEKKYTGRVQKIEISTNRQAGDIAGTKLKKFSRYFEREISRYFFVEKIDFEYVERINKGIIFLVAKPKKHIEIFGPPLEMREAVSKFKKAHKPRTIKTKAGRIYAVEKLDINLEKFLKEFRRDKKDTMKEMGVTIC